MANYEVKSKDGSVVGSGELSVRIAEAVASHTTIHRAVVAEEANKRQGTQSAKTRSETRGGGRKPYKQKKTGNARQGTIRAPHYAHGGMAFAVKPRDYTKKVNKQERRAAILTALSAHFEAGNVTVVDSLTFAEPKTKVAVEMLKALGLGETRRVLVILPQYDELTHRAFRNLQNVVVRTAPVGKEEALAEAGVKSQAFSARDVLVAHKIVIVKDALSRVESVWAKADSLVSAAGPSGREMPTTEMSNS
ncbi:50S ribosomal protein L4 [bacterium]|nr:MAG: 50S ribosomal protein L4 [bacterium]